MKVLQSVSTGLPCSRKHTKCVVCAIDAKDLGSYLAVI